MSKKTIALITGLVLLTVLLVSLAVQTSKPIQPAPSVVESEPTVEVEAKTILFMTPTVTGRSASVQVSMDSKDNEVTAVQMEISYDPKILSFVSASPSSIFSQGVPLINVVDKKNGRISYALGLSPQQAKSIHTGDTDVATLLFTKVGSASDSASTEVKFLPKSLVSASGVNTSVLKETRNALIVF